MLSDPESMNGFGSKCSAFNSFGPLINAMDTAPLTHINVPPIFATLLKLLIFTLSILN